MGCDIHCMIEHRDADGERWYSFAYNMFNPGRDYRMFALMANVRNSYDKITPLYETKGVPDDMSCSTKNEMSLFITDSNTDKDGYCSKENAERWVYRGWSSWVNENRVTHPDWHSFSWLSKEEYEKVIYEYGIVANYQLDASYYVIFAMLNEYEKRGRIARLVFWFDN